MCAVKTSSKLLFKKQLISTFLVAQLLDVQWLHLTLSVSLDDAFAVSDKIHEHIAKHADD